MSMFGYWEAGVEREIRERLYAEAELSYLGTQRLGATVILDRERRAWQNGCSCFAAAA